jgi:Mrp family chromosome partitioning ATPase
LATIVKAAPWSELVIVDTPATAFFADAIAIAAQCDVTLLVVNAQQSRRRAVRKLLAELRQVNATPIGVIVNWVANGSRSAQYYYRRR